MRGLRQQALQNITNKHYSAQKLREWYFDEVMKIPDVKDCYKQIRSLQIDIARAQYYNDDCTALLNQKKYLHNKMQSLLKMSEIDANKLKTRYNCPLCQDRGVVDGVDCACLKQEMANILLQKSGLNKDKLPNFGDVYFKIFGDNAPVVQKVYSVMQEYCDKLNTTPKKVVTITGSVGVGKTYLLECVVNDCISRGHYVIYTTAFNLNNDMLRYHTSPIEDKGEILQKYIDCDLLCIDDLGTETMLKNVTNEYLYQIISERLQQGKNTIITTNLELDQIIDTYDERIFSRIASKNNCVLIKMQGDDLRLKK